MLQEGIDAQYAGELSDPPGAAVELHVARPRSLREL